MRDRGVLPDGDVVAVVADVLEAARQHLAPELALDDFIRTALGDAHQRAAWTHALRGTAHAAMVPGFKSLAP